MNRDQKAAVVEEIAEQIQGAQAVFAVDYRGISVSQVAELRGRLRDADTKLRVVKNSLTERAADKAGAESLKPLLDGPTALALVRGDAALAAKALNDTARALNILEFKGGMMDGAALTADDVRAIARLPARDVLHGQLVGTIAAPLTGLVRTLNALIAGIAVQLKEIADRGLVSGEAPAEAEAEAEAPAAAEEAEAPAAAAEAEAPAAAEEAEAPAEEAEAPAAAEEAEAPAAEAEAPAAESESPPAEAESTQEQEEPEQPEPAAGDDAGESEA